MSIARLSDYDVAVIDRGVDALVMVRPDLPPLLVLRPFMSFGAAVRAITAVVPTAAPDEVRALVRARLPQAFDLDEAVATSLDDAGDAPVALRSALLGSNEVRGLSILGGALAAALFLLHAGSVQAEVDGLRDEVRAARADARTAVARMDGATPADADAQQARAAWRAHVIKAAREKAALREAQARGEAVMAPAPPRGGLERRKGLTARRQ